MNAPAITLVSYIRDLGLLPRALPVLRPFVARVLIVVEWGAKAEAFHWAAANADKMYSYRWADSYADLNNEIADRVTTPLLFQLDWDELIRPDFAARLPGLAATMARLDLDCTYVARRHWRDMAASVEERRFWPNWCCRLRKPSVRLAGRAHWTVKGDVNDWYTDSLVIEHYNMAMRDRAGWREHVEHMARLTAMDG